MLEQLEKLRTEALEGLRAVADGAALDTWQRSTLGRRGIVTLITRRVGELPKESRPAFGKRANQVKQELTAAYERKATAVKADEMERQIATGAIDVSQPGRPRPLGRLHPSTQVLREICRIWGDMGFQVYRSRDVETDEYNFQLLNMPPHHPARDMWDTFYTTQEGVVLRTHTSPGQIHAMHDYHPEPIRVILPGMCYRYEQISARSEIQFNQVEGLAVGKNITFADLKGTLSSFAGRLFGAQIQTRFRCQHFPFTEPSAEMDVECILCSGRGCNVCKKTGWLEILGCGMVHPAVLRHGGYDPAVYTGFAFGMGVERPAMVKYGIKDIRYFWSGDLRFLEQF
ncbi:MAG: phenylalanine--tRNA ligase subunit alpha [Ardenticatenales bacterium]|nr:phenylalanine--tRNA ligase subunit alpha [Ardenticatenales bacterium]